MASEPFCLCFSPLRAFSHGSKYSIGHACPSCAWPGFPRGLWGLGDDSWGPRHLLPTSKGRRGLASAGIQWCWGVTDTCDLAAGQCYPRRLALRRPARFRLPRFEPGSPALLEIPGALDNFSLSALIRNLLTSGKGKFEQRGDRDPFLHAR